MLKKKKDIKPKKEFLTLGIARLSKQEAASPNYNVRMCTIIVL